MLQILIQAETIVDLKSKTLAALNMFELPVQPMPTEVKPGEVQIQEEPVLDVKRAKKKTAKLAIVKEKIEDNFESAEEIEMPEASVEVEVEAPSVDLTTAQASLRALLKKMSTPDALNLLKKHGAEKVTLMNEEQRASFHAEAQRILGS